ncbi:MAG: hypothetical protein IKV82_03680 [Akkermansia sp.]|nr:hypothetical protein [Akkermansia sp.]
MKISLCHLIAAGMLLGTVLPAHAQRPLSLPPVLPGAEAWKSPKQLQQNLGTDITKRLDGLSPAQVNNFLKKAENRRLLWMYYLAGCEAATLEEYKKFNTNVQNSVQGKKNEIANLEKEVEHKKGAEKKRAQFRLKGARDELKKQLAESKAPAEPGKNAKVLQAVLSDTAWLEQILFSGEMRNFTRVIQILDTIADNDANALRKGVERDTATAIALEYARYGGYQKAAAERAHYFLKYWRQGRLNTTFDTLPLHQRRVVCGWKLYHSSGTIKAFEWALNNVHLPDWQYPASCWRCGYIPHNVYGDDVQGSWYAASFVGVYTDNHMAFTKHVGGVCGGLSHFGAASACANGVPGLTMGEPGHCAYIVLVDGKWTPAYSLTWERGLHWNPWDGNDTFTALHLTDALFDKENAADTRLSYAYRALAQVYRDRGDDATALSCYEKAAQAAPLNYPLWREYAAFLGEKMPKNVDAWKKLNEVLCAGMASVYPEQAAVLLQQCVYNRIANSGISPRDLADALAAFWKAAATMGPDRWRVEGLINRQLQMCKNASGNDESAIIDFYVKVISASAQHEAYSGIMMAWGNGISESLSEAGRQQLMNSTVSALTQGNDISGAQRSKLLGGLILTAERSRDLQTFHAISKMVDPKEIHGSAAIPAPTPFPGKLVSEGGMPFASSTSEWDAPHTHCGLLTQQGGRIHTGKDTNAWIAVKLPKHAYITGVVFAGTNVWELIHRFRPLRVQVSDTGRDDDWHDVGEAIPNTGNYINRFDLQKERPKALYVRVLRPGGPEFFHANGIYVYGEPAA